MSSEQETEKSVGITDIENHAEKHQEPEVAIRDSDRLAANEVQSPLLHGWRLYLVQVSLLLALLLGALDSSIVATALVVIGRDFNDFARLQWVVLAYLLTYLGFDLMFSRISDVLGRKWTSIMAVSILTIGSLGCGLSQNLTQLIAFRALQGLGGSGIYALPFTVLPEITPAKNFPLMSGVAGIVFISSAVLGPTLGGVITTNSTWRWVFLFNVPCGVLIVTLMLFSWPRVHTAGKISWRRLDVIGCFLSVTSVVLLIFGIQEGGAGAYAWSSPIIITTLTIAGVAMLAFVFWIWYLSGGVRMFAPLFPARIVLHRVLLANFLVSAFVGYILFTVIVGLPQRFQLVNHKSSQGAGVALLPLSCASALAAIPAGYFSSGKKNYSFVVLVISGAILLLGTGLLSTVGHSAAIPHYLYGYEILVGFGMGGTFVTTTVMLKLNANEEDTAPAQGLMSQARVLGGNIGLGIATIILNSHLTSDLAGVLTPQQIHALRGSLNTIDTLTSTEVVAVSRSFASAFKSQLHGCMGVAAASFVMCFLTWQRHPNNFVDLERERSESREARARVEAGATEV